MKKIPNIYIEENSFEKRQTNAVKVIERYPNKIPVVVSHDKNLTKHSFTKYMFSRDMEAGYILNLVRRNISINPNKGIFILTENGTMLTNTMLLDHVYTNHKNEDLHLYLYVYLENTFGIN